MRWQKKLKQRLSVCWGSLSCFRSQRLSWLRLRNCVSVVSFISSTFFKGEIKFACFKKCWLTNQIKWISTVNHYDPLETLTSSCLRLYWSPGREIQFLNRKIKVKKTNRFVYRNFAEHHSDWADEPLQGPDPTRPDPRLGTTGLN